MWEYVEGAFAMSVIVFTAGLILYLGAQDVGPPWVASIGQLLTATAGFSCFVSILLALLIGAPQT